MDKAKALAWFGELEAELRRVNETKVPENMTQYRWVIGWHTDADAAMHACLPANHPTLRRWVATKVTSEVYGWPKGFDEATALFETAHGLLRTGRLSSFVEAIRAETVGELLDQAESLLTENWLSAAMVTAGGAVESTLRHLCERASPPIAIAGHASIGAYRTAIEKEGSGMLRANQHDMIKVWNKLRNAAAHDPMKFQAEHTKDGVQNTINAIRIFLGSV